MHRSAATAGHGLQRLVVRHYAVGNAHTRAAPAAASSGRPIILDEKSKVEIRELHASDPGRWTAAALATRYGAPQENVAAIVRLAKLRKGERSETAAAIESAWIELGGRMPGARGRIRAPIKQSKRASSPVKEVEMKDEEEREEDIVDLVGTTETAQWASDRIAEGEVEAVRKTTYAFIEVGKGLDDRSRAVWLRDGPSGKLRRPTSEERSRLLGQRRVYEDFSK